MYFLLQIEFGLGEDLEVKEASAIKTKVWSVLGDHVQVSKNKGCPLKHDMGDYVQVLVDPEVKKYQEYNQISRSKNYEVMTMSMKKTSLTAFQGKL